MEPQIRAIGLLITFVMVLRALQLGRDRPALVFLILAPFSYFAHSIFVVVTPAKLMGLVFMGLVLVKPSYLFVLGGKYIRLFLPYFFYLLVLTLVMPLWWPEYNADQQGFFYSNTARGFVQIAQMFMGLCIVAVIAKSLSSASSLLRAQIALLATMIFICAYGIYVWFAQRLGLPFNPINRGGRGGELGREIVAIVDGVYRMRAYSVTGEPKTLAANACTGFMLIHFTAAAQINFFKGLGGRFLLTSLFFGTLILTLSTAGFMILPMMLIAAAFIQARLGQLERGSLVGLMLVGGITLLATIGASTDSIASLSAIFNDRLMGRLGEEGLLTYADAAVLSFWRDQPIFAITGAGLGGSSFYIRAYDVSSYAGFTAAPRGVIGFIADKGVVGLLLFLLPLYNASRPLFALAASKSPNRRIYVGVLIVCAVHLVLMFTAGQWHDEWIAIGLICAGAAVATRERRTVEAARNLLSFSPSPAAHRGLRTPATLDRAPQHGNQ